MGRCTGIVAVLASFVLLATVRSQRFCAYPTASDLEDIIEYYFTSGDSPQKPTVDVLNFHPVCLAYSEEQGRYRTVSVVVEYTCTGSAQCPSGTAVDQFESECSNRGVWTGAVGSATFIRTTDPTANFLTTTREDCSFCYSPTVATAFSITTDPVTHCVECNPSCTTLGLRRCFAYQASGCCVYYESNLCVTNCTGIRTPNNDFECVCPGFFTDQECTECGLVCENGGSPNELICQECSCPAGYTSYNCSEDINECDFISCLNDGTCVHTYGAFTCVCPVGTTGNLCEELDCFNGGTYTNSSGVPTCVCYVGYTGNICEEDINECQDSPCLNGGTCVNHDGSYSCTCDTGYSGFSCGGDIDECLDPPCLNEATCMNTHGSFLCLCLPGYTGPLCDGDYDECIDSPCLNSGTCMNNIGSFSCVCSAGYTSLLCRDDIDECTESPCLNEATCINKNGSFSCVCSSGYRDMLCGEDINECSDIPCLNGGTCINHDGSFSCICPQGYTNNLCGYDIDECSDTPCFNGATCTNSNGSFMCLCPTGLSGALCESDIDDCTESSCLHGGMCTDELNGFTCVCPSGWSGKNCANCTLKLCKACHEQQGPAVCVLCMEGYVIHQNQNISSCECGLTDCFACDGVPGKCVECDKNYKLSIEGNCICSGGYKEENGIRVCFETDLTPSSDRDDSNGFSLIILAVVVTSITGLLLFFLLATTAIVTAIKHDRKRNETFYNSTNGTSFKENVTHNPLFVGPRTTEDAL